ncbi:hypothetical protein [Streptomyces platensis]|uniref:hypothetical protein n=1 Tax=Streptomyces platensis TaxID=58346 RepID=UPI003863C225|nr:hypothetical protein OG962_06020 [Streptomyces platensis]
MSGGPVDPADVPVFTGDLDVLETKIKVLSRGGSTIETAGSDVHKSFGGLAAFYKAPEAEQLFGVTKPVEDTAHDLGQDMHVIAKALGTYAREITPLIEKFKQLKKEAADFQANKAAEDDWSEDGDLTDENLARRNKIAEVWTAFQEAERNCHAKIVGLVNGKALHVIDATHKTGYGYNAEDLKQAKSLPWGDAVEESIPGWQVWEHAWEFGKGFVVDGAGAGVEALKTLFGGYGGDAAGEAWLGLAKLSTGITITTGLPFLAGAYFTTPGHMLPSWLRESRTAMLETGKAFVAWDQWGSNNSRAAGAVTFNVLSAVITRGGGSAVAGAGKAATAAKAISVGSKVAQAIDPMTYVAKGAGVGLSKIRGVMAGLKTAGHLEVPKVSDGDFSLPEGAQELPDGTIQLPKDAAIPEGATRLSGGRIKLPEDTVTLPPGTVKSPLDGPGRYVGTDGSLYREDGSLLQKGDQAEKESVPNPKAGADNPRIEAPAQQKQPALAGVGGRGDDTLRVGSDVPEPGRSGHNAGHSEAGPRDNIPMGRAGDHTAPGGNTGNHMPLNNLDNGAGGAGRAGDNTPTTGDGRTDTPSTSGTGADSPSTGGGRNLPDSSTTDNGLPGSGHPENPNAGGLDDATHGADDATDGAGHAGDDADAPANHADGGTGTGDHGNAGERELTAAERKKLQDKHVWLANNNPEWLDKYYRASDGHRWSKTVKVDGVELPILKKLPDGSFVAKYDLPHGPSEVKHGRTPLKPDSTDPAHLPKLNEAAKNSRVSVDLTNAEREFKENPSTENQAALDDARKAYRDQLGDIPNNSKHSEKLGEMAARRHAIPTLFKDRNPEWIRLPKTPNGANMLDDLYKLDDGSYLVVEEKGPKADLNPPRLGAGTAANMMVKQGTKPYLQTIFHEMWKRGGKDRELAEALFDALEDGKLQYVLVKGKEKGGSYDGSVLEHFKVY